MRKRYWIAGGFVLYALIFGSRSPDRTEPPSPAQTQVQNSATPTKRPHPAVASKPSLPASTEIDSPQIQEVTGGYPRRYLNGSRVAFRDGPSTQSRVVDRYDQGREVQLIGQEGEWSRIRDVLTQREGWLASRYLSEGRPARKPVQERTRPRTEPAVQASPRVSDSVIVQRIIAESIASYPGSCPCPYNTDRGGRRCGKRSAYSKPGGYAPICFAGDVSGGMIAAFRRRYP